MPHGTRYSINNKTTHSLHYTRNTKSNSETSHRSCQHLFKRVASTSVKKYMIILNIKWKKGRWKNKKRWCVYATIRVSPFLIIHPKINSCDNWKTLQTFTRTHEKKYKYKVTGIQTQRRCITTKTQTNHSPKHVQTHIHIHVPLGPKIPQMCPFLTKPDDGCNT